MYKWLKSRASLQLDGFDWDEGNRAKCQKHGVSIAEIEALFHGSPGVYADPDHSMDEQRLRAIGRTAEGRSVIVAFTLRGEPGRRCCGRSAPVTCTPRRCGTMGKDKLKKLPVS